MTDVIHKEGLRLIETFEGYLRRLNDGTDRVRPYYCPAGVATIGIGTTRYPDGRRVQINDPPINRDTAYRYLSSELREDASGFDRLTTRKLHPLSRAALVSFCYNCGVGAYRASTLRRKVNAGEWEDVPRELAKWRMGGGRILPGLVRRRAAEAALFMRGVRAGVSDDGPPLSPPAPLPPQKGDDRSMWRRLWDWVWN
jgi:lysozyme